MCEGNVTKHGKDGVPGLPLRSDNYRVMLQQCRGIYLSRSLDAFDKAQHYDNPREEQAEG
jgi:hypothetical protein